MSTHRDPLDDLDLRILGLVGHLYDEADPPPATLVERVQFAIALEHIDEVLTQRPVVAAARGEERTRSVMFDGDSLTIMVTVSPLPVGRVRLDGWLAPPGAHPIEIRTGDGPVHTTADADGRFVVGSVPAGLIQLVVRTGGGAEGPPRSVVTPSIEV